MKSGSTENVHRSQLGTKVNFHSSQFGLKVIHQNKFKKQKKTSQNVSIMEYIAHLNYK